MPTGVPIKVDIGYVYNIIESGCTGGIPPQWRINPILTKPSKKHPGYKLIEQKPSLVKQWVEDAKTMGLRDKCNPTAYVTGATPSNSIYSLSAIIGTYLHSSLSRKDEIVTVGGIVINIFKEFKQRVIKSRNDKNSNVTYSHWLIVAIDANMTMKTLDTERQIKYECKKGTAVITSMGNYNNVEFTPSTVNSESGTENQEKLGLLGFAIAFASAGFINKTVKQMISSSSSSMVMDIPDDSVEDVPIPPGMETEVFEEGSSSSENSGDEERKHRNDKHLLNGKNKSADHKQRSRSRHKSRSRSRSSSGSRSKSASRSRSRTPEKKEKIKEKAPKPSQLKKMAEEKKQKIMNADVPAVQVIDYQLKEIVYYKDVIKNTNAVDSEILTSAIEKAVTARGSDLLVQLKQLTDKNMELANKFLTSYNANDPDNSGSFDYLAEYKKCITCKNHDSPSVDTEIKRRLAFVAAYCKLVSSNEDNEASSKDGGIFDVLSRIPKKHASKWVKHVSGYANVLSDCVYAISALIRRFIYVPVNLNKSASEIEDRDVISFYEKFYKKFRGMTESIRGLMIGSQNCTPAYSKDYTDLDRDTGYDINKYYLVYEIISEMESFSKWPSTTIISESSEYTDSIGAGYLTNPSNNKVYKATEGYANTVHGEIMVRWATAFMLFWQHMHPSIYFDPEMLSDVHPLDMLDILFISTMERSLACYDTKYRKDVRTNFDTRPFAIVPNSFKNKPGITQTLAMVYYAARCDYLKTNKAFKDEIDLKISENRAKWSKEYYDGWKDSESSDDKEKSDEEVAKKESSKLE